MPARRPAKDRDKDREKDRQFVTSLERGLQVLRAFSRRQGGLRNGQLAKQTKLAPSTISRLVYTLRELGYLSYDRKTRSYVLMPQVLSLGYPVLSQAPLLHQVRPGAGADRPADRRDLRLRPARRPARDLSRLRSGPQHAGGPHGDRRAAAALEFGLGPVPDQGEPGKRPARPALAHPRDADPPARFRSQPSSSG